MNGKCVMLPQPGLLAELTGTDVRDFTFTSPAEDEVFAEFGDKKIPMPVLMISLHRWKAQKHWPSMETVIMKEILRLPAMQLAKDRYSIWVQLSIRKILKHCLII